MAGTFLGETSGQCSCTMPEVSDLQIYKRAVLPLSGKPPLVLFSTSHVQYTIPVGICQGNEVYEKNTIITKKDLHS